MFNNNSISSLECTKLWHKHMHSQHFKNKMFDRQRKRWLRPRLVKWVSRPILLSRELHISYLILGVYDIRVVCLHLWALCSGTCGFLQYTHDMTNFYPIKLALRPALDLRPCKKNPNPKAGFWCFQNWKLGFWQRALGLQTLVAGCVCSCETLLKQTICTMQ